MDHPGHAAFEAWCSTVGIARPRVAAGWVADGWRGVIAHDAIPPDDVLLAVPAHLLLSAHSARRDAQLGPLLAQHPQLTSHQVGAPAGLPGRAGLTPRTGLAPVVRPPWAAGDSDVLVSSAREHQHPPA